MRLSLLVLLLLGWLVSCGKSAGDVIDGDGAPVPVPTDSRFDSYVQSFEDEYGSKVTVPIVFKATERGHAGVCIKWTNGYREININKIYWDSINELQREQLIYHELGHCVLDLGHVDNHFWSFIWRCPVSIMRSWAFSSREVDKCYDREYNYYMNELFN